VTGGGGNGEPDPFGDLFSEEQYNPHLAFAQTAANQAVELHDRAEVELKAALAGAQYGNPIAASGRKSSAILLERLASEALNACEAVEVAKISGGDADDAFVTYERCQQIADELRHAILAIGRTDQSPPSYSEPEIETTDEWRNVVHKTQQRTMRWLEQNRTERGKMLVLKPSPSCGKTATAITGALEEQEQRRRVVMAARTKAMLVDELAPRIRRQRPLVRLHVILGRDEETCLNYKNVAAVTAHGYAPGRTVCISCPHYPANAVPIDIQMCGYYESRIKAHNDSRLARWGAHRHYPIILTTHAGLLSAFHSGGGKWGAFWQTDTIFIDEDPTEAFEPTIEVTEDQVGFSSILDEDRYTSSVARTMLDTIRLAKAQRLAWESDPHHKEDDVHGHRTGSTYAGRILHSLFQASTNGAVLSIMRDACDRAASVGQGSLFGLESARDINQRGIPPAHFPRFAGTLMDELGLARVMNALLYQEVHGRALSPIDPPQGDQLARLDPPDTAYALRLEYDKKSWRFVLQDSTDLGNHTANVIIGDAYAHVGHYRQMFQKPEPTDPNDHDDMTVVDDVAHFPPNSTVVRIQTKSNVTHLANGYLQENLSLLHAMMSERGRDKRLLIYVHKRLREKVIEYLTANAATWGCIEWAVEHWWGGRGKDQYKNFDIVVCLSEPLMNLGGMLHVINARAFRDAGRAKQPADRLRLGERIGLPALNKGVAHGMARGSTHWRVAQEHRRQNVNELAQAIHRVRGLMLDGKLMVILGDALELPRDVLAATSMVTTGDGAGESQMDAGEAAEGKGRLVQTPPLGCVSAEEVVECIMAVIDHYGCWSYEWAHCLLTRTWEPRKIIDEKYPCDVSNLTTPPDPSHACLCPGPRLAERVWFPPPYWQAANQFLHGRRSRTMREARVRIERLVESGRMASAAAGGSGELGRNRPRVYYRPSELTASEATAAFTSVMRQYGRAERGHMYPDDPKDFVPF
jgi:hypothetical protein